MVDRTALSIEKTRSEYSTLGPIAKVCPPREMGIRSGRFFGEDDGQRGLN
jgi:hypothetical protein